MTATAEHVRIGSRTWSSVPLVLLDLTMLSRMHMASISGVLGTDLLSGMTMRLSYSSGVAEAEGIVVGDRISSVNGYASVELRVEEFAKQQHGAAGTPIAIEVDRPSGKSTLRIKTRQMVCESGAGVL